MRLQGLHPLCGSAELSKCLERMNAAAHIVLTEVGFRLELATCVDCTVTIN
jgi:hypothetical protein